MKQLVPLILLPYLSQIFSRQIPLPRTCKDVPPLKRNGEMNLLIDPDGEYGVEPFKVVCNFTTRPVTTILSHNIPNKTEVEDAQYHPDGNYYPVSYNLTVEQLRALVDSQGSCSQFLRYDCLNSLTAKHGDPRAFWWNREGYTMATFPGGPHGEYGCACAITRDCAGEGDVCNCEINDVTWRVDEGYVTDKELLPITQLYFIDTEDPDEGGFFTLGPLVCKAKEYDMPRSCTDVDPDQAVQGQQVQIDPDGSGPADPFNVTCDFGVAPVITWVAHNYPMRTEVVDAEDYPGNYYPVSYNSASEQALKALVDNEASCSQHLKYECRDSRNFFNNDPMALWWSRSGTLMFYFPGGPKDGAGCACGINGTCADPDHVCNCQINDDVLRSDEGTITDKDLLPISKLYFSDTSADGEEGYFTLGPLKCQAKEYDWDQN